jgi:hypothetical protein
MAYTTTLRTQASQKRRPGAAPVVFTGKRASGRIPPEIPLSVRPAILADRPVRCKPLIQFMKIVSSAMNLNGGVLPNSQLANSRQPSFSALAAPGSQTAALAGSHEATRSLCICRWCDGVAARRARGKADEAVPHLLGVD